MDTLNAPGNAARPQSGRQRASAPSEICWTKPHIRRDLPKIYSRELAEVIFVTPYCRISDLVTAGIAKRQAASVYLKAVTEHGLLQEMKAGRENLYINPALLALLSDRPPVSRSI